MKPSIELFKLIKSLSKSEKRFFKLSSSLQSGEKNYLKIFDAIEKQVEYDEEALKKMFKNETFIKHLPSEKNHLYRLILKSLRSFHSEQSISSLLKQELKNVEILYNKALYKECEKFVSRAKELAADHEKFYYWYELVAWQKKLLEEAYEEGEFSTNLDVLVEEEEMVIAKLRNLAEYQMVYSKINLIFRSGGFTRNEAERKVVDDIADYHLIKGKNTAISTRAASMCYYIKGLCAATVRNYADSFQFFNRTREILDANPKIKEDSAQRYVMTTFHLLRCYIENRDFTEAQNLLTEIRGLSGKKGFNTTDISVRIFSSSSNLELYMLQLKGDFHLAIQLLENIDIQRTEFADKISKEQEVMFLYNKAYCYFGIGEFKRALSFLNEVLNDNEQNLRQDIYSFSRILNLILHYELENYEFLEYVIKSTNRYLSKYERDYRIEDVFIKFLRKLSKSTDQIQTQEIMEAMFDEVQILMQNHDERVILEYFNMPAWLFGKINKLPFNEAVIAYNQKFIA
jgi:tetratricopeptide (TPR) repeat protein